MKKNRGSFRKWRVSVHLLSHMKSIFFLTSLLSALSFSACGGAGANDVAACKSFYASLKCGTTDLTSTASSCDSYANTTCDISAYFTCLQSHYVCTNGSYESTKVKTSGECSAKAVCQ